MNKKSERPEQIFVRLSEAADVAAVVMAARRLSAQGGFPETTQFLIATAVSELATNILRYAQQGSLQLKIVHQQGRTGIEVLAEDKGPGIQDTEKVMADHFSTGESLGLGLPSVKRIMDEFSIDSSPGCGTRILTTRWI